jgi:hypothetical protein
VLALASLMDMDFIPGNQLLVFIVAVLPSFAQNVLDERIPPHCPGTSECVMLLALCCNL